MMKKILYTLSALLIIFLSGTKAQTTAMEVTQADCGGANHSLYSELNAGNVVILEFVMLNCAPCIVGTKALESITAPYQDSHPGRVHIYSFAFLNTYTCEQISAWRTDNSFTHPVFNNGEEQVNYYGGMGMPTIVVVGTNEHKVFYKSIGYTPDVDDQVRAALDSALLYNPMGVNENIVDNGFSIYPTLFTDNLNVQSDKALQGAEIVLFDSFGRQVLEYAMTSDQASIPVAGLSKGLYIARLKTSAGISGGTRLIKQ
jgi:hypothetical protein